MKQVLGIIAAVAISVSMTLGADQVVSYAVPQMVKEINAAINNPTSTTMTVSGKTTCNGELEANRDVDINLTMTNDWIRITQTNVTGSTGTQPLISIVDERTGANADSAAEATLVITPSGTHAISVPAGISALQAIEGTTITGTGLGTFGALSTTGAVTSADITLQIATSTNTLRSDITGLGYLLPASTNTLRADITGLGYLLPASTNTLRTDVIGVLDTATNTLRTDITGLGYLLPASTNTLRADVVTVIVTATNTLNTAMTTTYIAGVSGTKRQVQYGTGSNTQVITFSPTFEGAPTVIVGATETATLIPWVSSVTGTNCTLNGDAAGDGTKLLNWQAIGTLP